MTSTNSPRYDHAAKNNRLTRKMVADEVDMAADRLYTMLRNADRTLEPDDPLLRLLHDMRAYANSIYQATYDAGGNRVRLPWAVKADSPLLLQGVKGE